MEILAGLPRRVFGGDLAVPRGSEYGVDVAPEGAEAGG
jgi:hypothetical protein